VGSPEKSTGDPTRITTTVVRNGRLVGGPGSTTDELTVGYVWADTEGNLLLVDEGRPRVFRVDTDGIDATAAGTGVSGYSGDGGPATEAQLKALLHWPLASASGRLAR